MRRKSRVLVAIAGSLTAAVSTGYVPSTPAAVLLYQWNFDQNGGTGSTVNPAVTPNSLASDGGVLTMAQFGGIGPFTPTNLYTASGGGVSGAAGDYAADNSASVSNNPTPGGIVYSSGVAAANNINTVNALPNFGGTSTNPTFTLTMWVKPTTAELAVQSRLMEIGTTSTFDESTNGLWVGLNTGKVQVGGSSAGANFVAGNTLVANTWNFIALEVDLTAANVFFDPTMQAATGSTLIGATAAQDSFVMYQGDQADDNYAYTYQNGWANGTMNFSGTQDYLQLLNRASNATRAFQGQGDDFRIYSGLLTTSQLQGIAAEAPVPEPATFASLAMAGTLLMRRRRTAN
jgi:hypothetical protein